MLDLLRFLVVLAIPLALAQAPAPPSSPPPPVSLATTYDLDLAGVGKGTEVVKLEPNEGGVRLTSRVEVTTPQGPMLLLQDSTLSGSPAEIVRYALSLEAPGEAGKGTMQAIRKDPKYRSLPIIAVTAKALKDDRDKCLGSGASDYLSKPVNAHELIELLRLWTAP